MMRRSAAEIAFRVILVVCILALTAFAFGLGEKGSDGGFFSPVWARVLGLTLFLMVFGVSFFRRGLSRHHMLRNALVWGSLIVALMFLYSLVKSLGLTMAP